MSGGPTRAVNIHYEPYDVYCGRAGRGEDGFFGNPYPVRATRRDCDVLARFVRYFRDRMARDAIYRARVEGLYGKRLGCFCKPGPCHVDVYVAHLNARPWLGLDEVARESFEERAAIREYLGGFERARAERLAYEDAIVARV